MQQHIGDYLRHLHNEKSVSLHTERGYHSDLEQLAVFLGDRDPAGITHQDLRSFLAHLLDRKIRKSSLARKLSAIRSFFKFLYRQGIVTTDPARLIATPKQEKRLPAVLTVDDTLRLLNAPAEDAKASLRDRAILETL